MSKTGGLLIGGLCVAGTLPLSAASLYDNSGSLLAPVEPGTYEIGDQIVLTGGDLFTLSGFSFQYWGTSANNTSFTGLDANGVQVQVSFYLNNGAADPVSGEATPGTRLWQSSWFGINPDADGALLQYDAVNDGFSGVTLPSSFTWSVKFQGMSTTDHVGVDSFSRALGAAGMDYP
ncbi:MAG TPA: hypothetical protein VNZ22_21340, partial [Bacillota bacterium]|nr:hypothetical protein [Bacillota bacterium]